MIGRGISIIIRRYVARPPSRDDGPLFTFLFSSIYALALINFVAFKERERENFSQCPCIMHNKWEREREERKNPSMAVIGTLDGPLAVRVSNWK